MIFVDNRNSLGFQVWRGVPRVMARAHLHCDVELNFLLSGEIEYFFGGRFQVLKAGEPTLFWAGMPHVLTRAGADAAMIWAVIPLAWLAQWQLPASFVDALLRGQMLVLSEAAELHRALMTRWCREWEADRGASTQSLVALELEALLRRMARQIFAVTPPHSSAAGGAQIEKLTAFIARHYSQEITVEHIARAANLHPNYAMALFKEKCGLSLWEYVTRLRVSHAQYLLLTTPRTVGDIARDAGFASDSRFYAAFAKYAGCAPKFWRRQVVVS